MKIGIYSEFYQGTTLGGREFIAAVLGESLGQRHAVEFIHHASDLTEGEFSQRFDLSPSRIRLRHVEQQPMPSEKNPWRRHHEEKSWHADLSRPYDLFVNIGHFLPPRCQATVGFLMVLFPFHDPRLLWDHGASHLAGFQRALWRGLRRGFHRWQWQRRLGSYQIKTSISEFSRLWTRRIWELESKVLYPPADAPAAPAEKSPLILSVGRFSTIGVFKRQEVMMRAFVQLASQTGGPLQGWEYVSTGGLGPLPAERAFFREVTALGANSPASVRASVPRDELRNLYARAAIFWHAAGHGQDENENPGLAEHYGIATVEAMFAGCVPVVIRKGAQPEIVEHGVSGFLWETPEELQAYTRTLASDDDLRARMSVAARLRAQHFSRERFIEHFVNLAQPHCRVSLLP